MLWEATNMNAGTFLKSLALSNVANENQKRGFINTLANKSNSTHAKLTAMTDRRFLLF